MAKFAHARNGKRKKEDGRRMTDNVQQYKYLFGPVPSRRFGRSLGVDLTPFKTCSFDCVFCQLGRTPKTTVERRAYVPIGEVLAELDAWNEADGQANYITLSGSGEPTLHSHFGEVLHWVRHQSSIPSALLTNGSMLQLPEVRKAARQADVVKVSLSAWNQESFGWINRPHASLQLSDIHEGLKAFRSAFKGELWMEIFLVAGMNSIPADVRKIASLAKDIQPDRIQLNTSVRPPAEEFAAALSKSQMEALRELFEPTAEVIAEFTTDSEKDIQLNEETILAMLKRRPCTAEHISQVFGMHLNEVSKYLGKLIRTKKIRTERKENTLFYFAYHP